MKAAHHRTTEEISMTPDEQDFYLVLLSKLEYPWNTVDIYSISACFGFDLKGMHTFSGVLSAMRTALQNQTHFAQNE